MIGEEIKILINLPLLEAFFLILCLLRSTVLQIDVKIVYHLEQEFI